MKALVGYTGFVGSNLALATKFDCMYNSKNIKEAYGSEPELLVYAGVPAAKYLANKAPEEDLAIIRQAEENIARIAPRKLVLISTIDVFPAPVGVDEQTIPAEGGEAYGRNRRELELWVREHYSDALIVRLPALFGHNLKKNFIYDILHPIPFRLTEQLFDRFGQQEAGLTGYYEPMGNGFYQRRDLNRDEEKLVKDIFSRLDFSALNFTDSRSSYQFYPLSRLWQDIETALAHELRIFHPATEPVTAGELYENLTGQVFSNEFGRLPAHYDYHTCYGDIFGGMGDYIMDKKTVMKQIGDFCGAHHAE
ncbi:MAG: sugar nucleotide-binding protein [Butyrivibrio sp.]|nr:sugar nucleotide-binding protein [Butyrivibrio sp.]